MRKPEPKITHEPGLQGNTKRERKEKYCEGGRWQETRAGNGIRRRQEGRQELRQEGVRGWQGRQRGDLGTGAAVARG